MFLSTISGILLKDQVGNEFITIALYGFPAECGTQVFHALPGNGRMIGEHIREVSHADIALVKLQDTETFSNATFQNDQVPHSVQLTKLARTKNLQQFYEVSIDSIQA